MKLVKRALLAIVLCSMTAASASALEVSDVIALVHNRVNTESIIGIVHQQRLPRPPTAHEVSTLYAAGASEALVNFMFTAAAQSDHRDYAMPYVYGAQTVVVAPPPQTIIVTSPPPAPPPPRVQTRERELPGLFQFLGMLLDDDHDDHKSRDRKKQPSKHDDKRGKPAPSKPNNGPAKPNNTPSKPGNGPARPNNAPSKPNPGKPNNGPAKPDNDRGGPGRR